MKKRINLIPLLIAILLFCILLIFPVFESLPASKALALLVLIAILWISEALPLSLTALLIPIISVLLTLANTQKSFSEFANPIIFLFMGGFVLAGALTRHSLDKLLAQKLIKFARGNFYWSAVLLMLATSFMACWVSNTSSTAMMIPLGLGILSLVKKDSVSPESKFLILGIAYSANIGGVITMTATPPNAIGAAILGLSFSEWLKYSLPVFLFTFPTMVIILTAYFKPDKKMIIGEMMIYKENNSPNKTLAFIFGITIILWMMDGALSRWFSVNGSFNSLVAIFAIFLVFITGVLTWDEIKKSIQWDILLLFGGGLSLGMIIESSGLGALLINQITFLISVIPLLIFIWLVVIFSIVLTEFMSNTASAALILPLLFTMANQLEINPMILVLPATIAASFGFMLPMGTPPNAMVYATGLIPQKDMLKVGLRLNIISSIILTTFFYFLFK